MSPELTEAQYIISTNLFESQTNLIRYMSNNCGEIIWIGYLRFEWVKLVVELGWHRVILVFE